MQWRELGIGSSLHLSAAHAHSRFVMLPCSPVCRRSQTRVAFWVGDLHAADVHRGKKFSRDTLPAIATPLQHWRFPVPGAGEVTVAALALPHAAALPG